MKTRQALAVLGTTVLVALPLGPLSAQAPPDALAAADLDAGARIFATFCVRCHGRDGTGGLGPNLTTGTFRHVSSDSSLYRVIDQGLEKRGMPAVGWALTENERWHVVGFVRSLSTGRAFEVPGDSASGAAIFAGRGTCATCHMVGGVGGTQGPDLSSIGWQRSVEYLRASLLDPNGTVLPEWWSVRVEHADGSAVEGRRMDEDTYSVRMLDATGELRGFQKGEVAAVRRIETSVMPSYDGLLANDELQDLVAYMHSLRKRRN